MKKSRLFAVALTALLSVGAAWADVEPNYKMTFDDAIDTSSPSFAPYQWKHRVDSASTGHVIYTYYNTGGYSGGYLSVGSQTFEEEGEYYWDDNTVTTQDALITPKVAGNLTLYVRKNKSDGNIKFYKYTSNYLSSYNEIEVDASGLTTTGFTKLTIPTDSTFKNVAIIGEDVDIDEFEADSVQFNKALTIVSAKLKNYNYEPEVDAEGNYKIVYNVTLQNSGDYDLAVGDDNYSLSLYVSQKDNVIGTAAVTEPLAVGATLTKPVEVTGTLSYDKYPNPFISVIENVSGTTKLADMIRPVPYAPVYSLLQKTETGTSTVLKNDPINFGDITGVKNQQLIVVNTGTAPLEVKSITVTGDFSTTTQPATVAAKDSLKIDIIPSAGFGQKTGNIVIAHDSTTSSYVLNGNFIDPDVWYENFENKTLGFLNEGWSETIVYRGSQNKHAMRSSTRNIVRLITPKLEFGDNGSISFEAAKQDFDYAAPKLLLLYSTDRENWTAAGDTISTFSDETESYSNAFSNYSVNIPAGQYYVAFDGVNVTVDNITGGKLVDVPHDVILGKVTFPASAIEGKDTTATVVVKNINLKDEDSYTAKLFLNGEEAATAEAVKIPASDSITVTFTFQPAVTDKQETYIDSIYAQFDFGDDYVLTTDTAALAITTAYEDAQKPVADTIGVDNSASKIIPIESYQNSVGTQYSKTEVIYTADEIGLSAGDKITQIVFKGVYTSFSALNFSNLTVAIGSTTDNDYSAGAVEHTGLTEIFNDALRLSRGGSASGMYGDNPTISSAADLITIDLTQPYVYDGKNIVLNISAQTTATYKNVAFVTDNVPTNQTIHYCGKTETGEFKVVEGIPVAYIIVKKAPKSSDGIEKVVVVKPTFNADAPLYNLAGQRVSKNYKGVVIQNGKKYLNK